LRGLPAGQTTTYGAIAAMMGTPRDARDVTAAIAANTIAILIPCHRVVKTDGSLSGYRWGVQRKRALLARERNAVAFQLA
jgi:AraC family transcriptional regulator of adaptative response/methylated-DNA-[protein]-cysteine methyltransferase